MEKNQAKGFLFISLYVLSGCLLFIFLMSDFKIASLNLNGTGDIRKRLQLYELMKLTSVNVTFVQETHSDQSSETD